MSAHEYTKNKNDGGSVDRKADIISFLGRPSGIQIGVNTGTWSNFTFGRPSETSSTRESLGGDTQTASRRNCNSHRSHTSATQYSEQSSGRFAPVITLQTITDDVKKESVMVGEWLDAHRKSRLGHPPSEEINKARNERADAMTKLQDVSKDYLAFFDRHGCAPISSLSTARNVVETKWRLECQAWMKHIQDENDARAFVALVLLEERLLDLDRFRLGDSGIKVLLQLLPEGSGQRIVVASLLMCNRADMEISMADDSAKAQDARTRIADDEGARSRYQTTFDHGNDSDGESWGVMSGQVAALPGSPGPEMQSQGVAEKITVLPYTWSEADIKAYITGMDWQDAYETDRLFPVDGERESKRNARAIEVAAKLSAYDQLRIALEKRPIDLDQCACITKEVKHRAELEGKCAKEEQKAWTDYIDSSSSGRDVRIREHIESLILENELCNPTPSNYSDEDRT